MAGEDSVICDIAGHRRTMQFTFHRVLRHFEILQSSIPSQVEKWLDNFTRSV